MTPLFKKLNLGTHSPILILDPPDSWLAELDRLSSVTIARKAGANRSFGFLLGFAVMQADLDRISSVFAKSASGDAIVWLAYPKATSKRYRCQFNRDTGWHVLGQAGFEPVRQVAIDQDWSAMRFRRTEFIRHLTRPESMAISNAGKRRIRGQVETTSAEAERDVRPLRTALTEIPGIGRTFTRDFARIGVASVEELAGQDPQQLFAALCRANLAEGHTTSKNYLYVLRMAIYFANGGRDTSRLKWNAWKDSSRPSTTENESR
jgi:hypothetical protein